MHCLALAVNDPAVGENGSVGRTLSLCTDGGEQGGLEPASVLVCALEVHIGRPFHVGVVFKHREMA